MYYSKSRSCIASFQWGFISRGCIHLAKKNSLHIVYEFQSLWRISIVPYRDFKCSEVFHFCLTYNTLIVQINNTICRIFIPSLPIFTFLYFSFHIFLGKLSIINNYINNICDLRSPSYNKLVHGNKNDNFILSLKRIS